MIEIARLFVALCVFAVAVPVLLLAKYTALGCVVCMSRPLLTSAVILCGAALWIL